MQVRYVSAPPVCHGMIQLGGKLGGAVRQQGSAEEVVGAERRCGRGRRREIGRYRGACFVQTVHWNFISLKRNLGEGIDNYFQGAVLVEALRKIAGAFRGGGRGQKLRSRGALRVGLAGEPENRLVPAVVKLGDVGGSADGSAIILPVVIGTGYSVAVAEEVVGGKIRLPQIAEAGPVELVRA